MNCPRCKHVASDPARFCGMCGSTLRPTDPAYQLSLAHRLEVSGDLEAAAGEYERVLHEQVAPTEAATVHKHLGNLHFRLGHLRRARRHLGLACELEPDHPTFWHDKGVIEYHMADFDAAVSSLREALARDPELHLTYFWLGNALYHRGDNDDDANAFCELLGRFPNFTIARFHLAVIYERQGRKDEAEKEFRRVLSANPGDAAAQYYVCSDTTRGRLP